MNILTNELTRLTEKSGVLSERYIENNFNNEFI